jgi:hypothetical protein
MTTNTHQQYHHRRPLSPVSVGDVCNRISKVSFENNHHINGTRIRNRSAEPRHLDKPHDNRPPSVNAIRSVVPDRLQQDQIPICSRPDSGGTKGQSITLYTNHFKCNLPDNLAIVSLILMKQEKKFSSRINILFMLMSLNVVNGVMQINVNIIVLKSYKKFLNVKLIIYHLYGKYSIPGDLTDTFLR